MGLLNFGGSIFPAESKDIRLKKDIEYLLGFHVPGQGRLMGKLDENRIPLLGSPFNEHLNEVNRFLFDGGITLDVKDAEPDDPRQEWLEMQVQDMRLGAKLKDLWKQGAVSGEVFATFTLAKDAMGNFKKTYNVTFFDRSEFTPVYDEYQNLVCVKVFSTYVQDGKEVVLKRNYHSDRIEVWPLMPMAEALKKDLPEPEIYPHPYQMVPGVLIKNQESITSTRGISEFDAGAIDMATEIALALCDAASNYHYFGDPKILTPDPEQTLREIRARSQVMLKDDELANGNPEFLKIQPVPSDHPKFVQQLTMNLRKHLGSPSVDASGVSDGTSSLTLRMLNAATISTAEDRWQSYVENGLKVLFQKMLIAAAFDGMLSGVTPLDHSTYCVSVKRRKPYFSQSPTERAAAIANADSLIMTGVRKEVALSEEVYTEMSPEQVLERLEGDL